MRQKTSPLQLLIRIVVFVFGIFLSGLGILEIMGIVVRSTPPHFAPALIFIEENDGWLKLIMGVCFIIQGIGFYINNRNQKHDKP